MSMQAWLEKDWEKVPQCQLSFRRQDLEDTSIQDRILKEAAESLLSSGTSRRLCLERLDVQTQVDETFTRFTAQLKSRTTTITSRFRVVASGWHLPVSEHDDEGSVFLTLNGLLLYSRWPSEIGATPESVSWNASVKDVHKRVDILDGDVVKARQRVVDLAQSRCEVHHSLHTIHYAVDSESLLHWLGPVIRDRRVL